MCGVRDSSPARWLPSCGRRLPLGGVRWNCYAPARHAPTAVDVKHVAHLCPLSLTVPFTHPHRSYWHNPLAFETTGGEGEGRRRRWRRKNRRCSRPSVVLAGKERLRRSACGLKVMLATTLAIPSCISPLPSLFDSSIEIRRDSGDSAMRRRSRRWRSPVLAVFGGTGKFRRRRRGGLVGVVMPIRRHALVLHLDWAGVSRFV